MYHISHHILLCWLPVQYGMVHTVWSIIDFGSVVRNCNCNNLGHNNMSYYVHFVGLGILFVIHFCEDYALSWLLQLCRHAAQWEQGHFAVLSKAYCTARIRKFWFSPKFVSNSIAIVCHPSMYQTSKVWSFPPKCGWDPCILSKSRISGLPVLPYDKVEQLLFKCNALHIKNSRLS